MPLLMNVQQSAVRRQAGDNNDKVGLQGRVENDVQAKGLIGANNIQDDTHRRNGEHKDQSEFLTQGDFETFDLPEGECHN